MKKSVLAAVFAVSLTATACEMEDAYVSDFLNDLTVNMDGDNGPVCGDGQLAPGEECDDGNTWSGDGCDTNCRVESGWTCPWPGEPCYYEEYCGDGIVQWWNGEECDDGNYWDGDGCTSWCTVENKGCYWDDDTWYAPGEVIWPEDNTYYCVCTSYNWFECYDVYNQGCYDDAGNYYEYGAVFTNEEGATCKCSDYGEIVCDEIII